MARKKNGTVIDADISAEEFDSDDNKQLDNLPDDDIDDISSDDFGGLYDDGYRVMEKHNELLRGLTDFDPYLQQKFTQWCGSYWDEEKKQFVRDPQIKPIINEQGARFFISFLQTYVRHNNIIANIPIHVFNYAMRDAVQTVFQATAQYWKEFCMQSVADQQRLATEVENSAFLILTGSVGGEYNKFIGGTYRAGYQDNMAGYQGNLPPGTNMPPIQKKKGILNRIKNVFS